MHISFTSSIFTALRLPVKVFPGQGTRSSMWCLRSTNAPVDNFNGRLLAKLANNRGQTLFFSNTDFLHSAEGESCGKFENRRGVVSQLC